MEAGINLFSKISLQIESYPGNASTAGVIRNVAAVNS